ncbi:universal stress protein [Candidatus Nitrosotenuis sp. DW1]|uniref:universal stress protein n=1 Tax=Candidatus Nitrosotenuis sp. DW1 TaxID=2259672 RepID=UPI0015C964B2|nr:universal stress protein [Candidatus Nitrosotenuis sp. DW1]
MYKKILVPYDGSKQSDKALKHACDLAKHSGAHVFLLNVVPDILLPPLAATNLRGEGKSSKDLLKELYFNLKSNAKTMLESKKKNYEEKNVTISIFVTMGNTTAKIIEYIKEKNVDLVVLGTTGMSGFSKIKALGSVARNVSEKSPCPVLLVP